MDNLRILGVQIVECVTKLIGPTQHFILRKRRVAMRLHFRQVLSRDVLHHQELTIAFVEMVADARQRRVMQPRQQTRLALELLAQLLIGKKRFFQRHRRIKPLVHGLVNRAHAALSKLPNDAVTSL